MINVSHWVNNGALWVIRHVAMTVVNKREHETENEGSLPHYSQRIVLCVYRGVSYEQESANPGTLSGNEDAAN